MPEPLTSYSEFIHTIKKITEIPAVQEKKFRTILSVRHMDRGEHFIRAGRISRTIAFVKKGLFRYYYTSEEGVEFTKGFFDKKSILSAYDAILENVPSYYSIEALEDSVIETVNYDRFHQLFPEDPCWNEFLVTLLQKGYLAKVQRERELLLMDAEQRYQAFLERFPNLEKRVKQHMIASYIGITPESLSRVRKKMRLLT